MQVDQKPELKKTERQGPGYLLIFSWKGLGVLCQIDKRNIK